MAMCYIYTILRIKKFERNCPKVAGVKAAIG